MPIGTNSGTPGADSVKAKAAITWVAVADGVKAEVRLTTACSAKRTLMRLAKTFCKA